jgi:DNA-binding beta-propeller fold protein YncE
MKRPRTFGRRIAVVVLATSCATPVWSGTITKGTVSHPGGNTCTAETLATFVSGGEDVIVIFGDPEPLETGSVSFSPAESGDEIIGYQEDQYYWKTVTAYRGLDAGQQYHIIYGACGEIPSSHNTYEIFADACSAAPPPPPALTCYWDDPLWPYGSSKPLVRWPTVLIGYPVQRSIEFNNLGGPTLNVTLSVNCSEFSIVGNTAVSIPGGGWANVTLLYDPTIEDTVAGELSPLCSGSPFQYLWGGSSLLASAIGPRLVVATPSQILRRQLDGSPDIELGTGATHVDLAFSQGTDIYAARRGGNGGLFKGTLDGPLTAIVAGTQPWCVDYDPLAAKVYWAADGVIKRANPDGTSIENLLTYPPTSPVDLVLDPERGQIYWTGGITGQTSIVRANLDGSNSVALLELPTGGNPRLALDREAGWLYWSEDTTSRIRRMFVDGTHVQTLLTPEIVTPASVGLDAAAGQIYWTDVGTNSVHRVDLDGENHVEMLTGTSGLSGLLLLLPPRQKTERVFWSDPDNDAIHRALKNGTGTGAVASGLSEPRGLALDAEAGQLYYADPVLDRISRVDVDNGTVLNLVTTGLDVPEDVALDLAAGKMYWTDSGATDRIQRANLNGSAVETLIASGLSWPRGIALDPAAGKMYWTEITSHAIYRADMALGATPELVVSGLSLSPQDIDLDVIGGKMYWVTASSGVTGGALQRANLDGSGIETLQAPFASTAAVALDLGARKVYWSAVSGNPPVARILRASLDTGDFAATSVVITELITGASPAPGLAVEPRAGFPTTSDAGDRTPVVPRIHVDVPRPNPFNPSTQIAYAHAGGVLDLSVYDVRGRLVRRLITGTRAAGTGTVVWDGKDDGGNISPSGLYFVQLRSNQEEHTTKAVLVR